MNSNNLVAPEQAFGQYVILSKDHRAMLKNLKSRRRLSYSETIRRGIELVANQFSINPNNHVAYIDDLHNADKMSAEVYRGSD